MIEQLLSWGQHSTVVLLATTIYVRADSLQKLLGRPASEQGDQPEAHRDMTDLMVV